MSPFMQVHCELAVVHSSPSCLVIPASWHEEASTGTGTGNGRSPPQNIRVHPDPTSPQKQLLQSSIQVSPTVLFLPSVSTPQSATALVSSFAGISRAPRPWGLVTGLMISEQPMSPFMQVHCELAVVHSSPSCLVTPSSWHEEASTGTGSGSGRLEPQNFLEHPGLPGLIQVHLLHSSIHESPICLLSPSLSTPQSTTFLSCMV